MGSPQQSHKWMSFLADNILDEEGQPCNGLLWSTQEPPEQGDCRHRDDLCGGGSKACREKKRRDRLNDRFLELSAILDPDRPPKTDKIAIISDAIRVLKQLKVESQQLRDANDQLREAIKELKAGKSELRDEKLALKSEKEKLEQQLKCMTTAPGFVPHPAAVFHAATTSFAAQNHAASTKAASFPGYPGIAMWQWLPPAAIDTSQDHVLRPPVA